MGGFIWFISPPETSSFGSGLNRLSVDFLKDDLHPIEGGHFLAALDAMPELFKMPFVSIEGDRIVQMMNVLQGMESVIGGAPAAGAPTPKKNKVKYSCDTCKTNVWGKPDLKIICGACEGTYVEQ
jgi:hypothetical protein